jgi:hypothetical protein
MRLRPDSTWTNLFTVLFVASVCLLTIPCGRIVAAEKEDPLQREQEEAQKEDAADQALGEGASTEKTYSGRLVLGQVVEGRADIIGLFTIDKGKSYPVKLRSEDLMNELKPYDHKTVALQGKFRNQGQYFVVTGIIPPPAPTPEVGKLGGL